ncbi:MAG: metallophosphoesterase family protein [Lachnospiraceae bacterium]|nr:metallophosphoesterase family protein [Lachnospiraceae bacterium]
MENNPYHRIAVLADTHGLLRPEITEILGTCEVILHGGDLSSRKILDELEQIAPVHVVRGNNDKEWAEGMAEELDVTLFGLRIYMIHNQKHRRKNLEGIDLFIYGHSHKYEQKTEEGVCFLNPGSCGPRRFRLPVTMAVLEVQEGTGQWRVEKIDLTGGEENRQALKGLTEENLEQTVQSILRDMKAGRQVETIARRLGLDREFVEQVCRIYVTHPGVDAQGIVSKMEVNALFQRRG